MTTRGTRGQQQQKDDNDNKGTTTMRRGWLDLQPLSHETGGANFFMSYLGPCNIVLFLSY